MRSIFTAIIFCVVFSFQFTLARFIDFFQLKHPQTGQCVILIGDCHGVENLASENRAALINFAHTYDAHIIVEDMSDYSMFARYLPEKVYNENDFFSFHSLHSRKRMAYTSLSLTYHCKRKNVSVTNVEFRHGGGLGDYSFLPMNIYYDLIDHLVGSIWQQTKDILSQEHRVCLQKVMSQIYAFIEKDILLSAINPIPYDESSIGLSDIDLRLCLMLDILMMQDFIEKTKENPKKTIIMCAGAYHIENIKQMLNAMHYQDVSSVRREIRSYKELRLRDVFAKHIEDTEKIKKCSSTVSIGFNDRKRVYWSVTKKAIVSGAALTTLASMFYIYSKDFRW
ncbi:MAG: hypothetical protein WD055_04415 [Candidatus Dependentiae bacterium]